MGITRPRLYRVPTGSASKEGSGKERPDRAMLGVVRTQTEAPLHLHVSMCNGGLQKGLAGGEYMGPAPWCMVERWWLEVHKLVPDPLHTPYIILCYPGVL